ncbi:hypothetical protein NIES2104_36600 [Leptolyngbya sp. NIES-2104]|nr:hypothetical protein NIES2104_36600 [Leptolyngbya sp. NIES-2104]
MRAVTARRAIALSQLPHSTNGAISCKMRSSSYMVQKTA